MYIRIPTKAYAAKLLYAVFPLKGYCMYIYTLNIFDRSVYRYYTCIYIGYVSNIHG